MTFVNLRAAATAALISATLAAGAASASPMNLLDNAVKYAPDRGRIQVESRREGDEAGVIVTDSGPGVPEDMLEKVTQRFFRADSSRNTPGTGLGLSLVEAVAKLHQGRLVLENRHPGFRATLIISADDN